jgi:hypothetical protein
LNQFVGFHDIQQGGYAIEDDLDSTFFNPIASTILKWQTFQLLTYMQHLHQSVLDYEILYPARPLRDEQLLIKLPL